MPDALNKTRCALYCLALACSGPLLMTPTTDAQPITIEQRAEMTRASYDELLKAYLTSDWTSVEKAVNDLRVTYRLLDAPDQAIYRDIRTGYAKFNPAWWPSTKSSSKTEFRAEIWDKTFMARYEPSGELGFQGVRSEGRWVRTRAGYEWQITSLDIFVTWKPNLVDNPQPAGGQLSKTMGYTLGDLAEVIVWHELGHNFLTGRLPVEVNVELYTDHLMLYTHLQEFFADLTAIQHCSPRARRAALQFRLHGLDYYDETSPHTRGAHGIGALLLVDVLSNPDKWPSIQLPPSVPAAQPELNTLIYIYENWKKDWTVEEALRLQNFAGEFVKKQGDKAFRAKGEFPLGNGTSYCLTVAQDREHQVKRDKWVSDTLAKLVVAGKTTKPDPAKPYKPRVRAKAAGDFIIVSPQDETDNPRIDIPW